MSDDKEIELDIDEGETAEYPGPKEESESPLVDDKTVEALLAGDNGKDTKEDIEFELDVSELSKEEDSSGDGESEEEDKPEGEEGESVDEADEEIEFQLPDEDSGTEDTEDAKAEEEQEEREEADSQVVSPESPPAVAQEEGDTKEIPVVGESEQEKESGDVEDLLEESPETPLLPITEEEAEGVQGVIRQMRQERETFLGEIRELTGEKGRLEQDNLGLRAELEDAKLGLTIAQKRHREEIDEMNHRVKIAEEKKSLFEERMKKIQSEFNRLEGEVRLDFGQVKKRERELESRLEMMEMDSEAQMTSRDKKILDLKRKIDRLEFNMETASMREKQSRKDKEKIEERMNRVMKTLKGSIELLEEEDTIPVVCDLTSKAS